MINAGLTVLPFDGGQSYNAGNGTWSGVKVRVNYPGGQSVNENPVSIGDFIIEPNGNAWEVMSTALASAAQRNFIVSLKLVTNTPSEEVAPDMGNVSRGAVLTPKRGMLAPHWDATLVSDEIGRIANMLTADRFMAGMENTQVNNYTGREGELTVNTETKNIHVHDGARTGGYIVGQNIISSKEGNAVQLDFAANEAYAVTFDGPATVTMHNRQANVLNEMIGRFSGLHTSAVTWPDNVMWLKSDGSFTNNTATLDIDFSDMEWIVFWSYSNNTEIFAKVMR